MSVRKLSLQSIFSKSTNVYIPVKLHMLAIFAVKTLLFNSPITSICCIIRTTNRTPAPNVAELLKNCQPYKIMSESIAENVLLPAKPAGKVSDKGSLIWFIGKR